MQPCDKGLYKSCKRALPQPQTMTMKQNIWKKKSLIVYAACNGACWAKLQQHGGTVPWPGCFGSKYVCFWCLCPFAGARLSYPGPCTRAPSQASLAKGLLGTCERAPKHGGSQLLRWEQGHEKQNSSAQAPGQTWWTPARRRSNWRRKRRRRPKKGPWRRSGLERFQEDLEWPVASERGWVECLENMEREEEEAAAAKAREDQKQPATTKKEEPEEERNVLRGPDARWTNRTGSSKQKSKLRRGEKKALEEGPEMVKLGALGGLRDQEARCLARGGCRRSLLFLLTFGAASLSTLWYTMSTLKCNAARCGSKWIAWFVQYAAQTKGRWPHCFVYAALFA